MITVKGLIKVFTFAALFTIISVRAQAYPVLQLYMEGSTYDPVTDTWTVTAPTFDLWVIGDLKFGTIYDVKLSAAFFGTGGDITITPKTTTLITDPSTPPPTYVWSTGTGGNPPLPDHGVFNDPALNSWTNYYLGDLSVADSPIGDFMTSFPSTFDSVGQVNVYEVTVTGWTRVHFDAFDHTVMTVGKDGREKIAQWKAPFSHDAQHVVPEPATIALLSAGLGALFLAGGIRRSGRRP